MPPRWRPARRPTGSSGRGGRASASSAAAAAALLEPATMDDDEVTEAATALRDASANVRTVS